ncbi:FAD binding domain-containing protein [candidate division KSB1 bacterium]
MKNFKYVDAKSLESAAAALGNNWDEAVVKGGGTDLLGELKDMIIPPKKVINLKNIENLGFIKLTPDGGLRIGAATTITEIAESPIIKEKYTVIAQASSKLASPQLRNMGTIGGNLCQRPRCWYYRNKDILCIKQGGSQCYAFTGENKYHCLFGGGPCFIVHPSDMAPALISCDAKIKIFGKNGEKEIELDKFYVLPSENLRRENVLKPDEIVAEIIVPGPKANTKSIYVKQGIREIWDFAICSVAVSMSISGLKCDDVRIVLGGAAPKPWRSIKAENELKGKSISENVAESAAKAALSDAQPLRDNRYKIKLFQNVIKMAILNTIKN